MAASKRAKFPCRLQASGIQYGKQAVWGAATVIMISCSLTGRSMLQILLAVFVTPNDNAGSSNENLETGISFADVNMYEKFQLLCICHTIINHLWRK
jgi:hypothetical protein